MTTSQEKQAAVAGWSGELRAEVAKLWHEGLSAKQIADKIGRGKSRNAVIGVLHRMGVSQRGVASAPREAKPKAPAKDLQRKLPRAKISAAPDPLKLPRPVTSPRDEAPGSATVLTLGAHMCKWPIGDPSSDSFTFCGGRRERGSYCSKHARYAFRTVSAPAGSPSEPHRRYA